VKSRWKVRGEFRDAVPATVREPLAPANRPVPPGTVKGIVNAMVVGFTKTDVLVPEKVMVSPFGPM
jgi:hypothetical protein